MSMDKTMYRHTIPDSEKDRSPKIFPLLPGQSIDEVIKRIESEIKDKEKENKDYSPEASSATGIPEHSPAKIFNYVPQEMAGYLGELYVAPDNSYAFQLVYAPLQDYGEQKWHQKTDLHGRGIAKRWHVHFSAGDMGAHAYTTLTDANKVFDTDHQYKPLKLGAFIDYHETHHRPEEGETNQTASAMLNFSNNQGMQYNYLYR